MLYVLFEHYDLDDEIQYLDKRKENYSIVYYRIKISFGWDFHSVNCRSKLVHIERRCFE